MKIKAAAQFLIMKTDKEGIREKKMHNREKIECAFIFIFTKTE